MEKTRTSDAYMTTVVVAGAASFLAACFFADPGRIDAYLVALAAFTIAIGSRATIKLPRIKTHVSVSDTFIFLILLLYGGELAIVVAAVEATVSAWRFCNRKLTVFFNAATMALSMGAVIFVLKLAGLYAEIQVYGQGVWGPDFLIALSLIALTQFIVNTALASIHDTLKDGVPLWETWTSKYIWTFFTYFIGTAGAGLLVQVSGYLGFGVVAATFPIITFVFLAYRMYLKNVEMSVIQADQAKQYAHILEAQSEALRESEERFRSAFDYAPIGIGLVSPTGRWVKANHALTEILGYSEEDFLATDFQSMIAHEDLGPTLMRIHELVAGKIATCQMEQRYLHKTGKTVWTLWSVSTTTDSSKNQNLIFQIQDITAKKSAEEQLQHEATHDALTGLPNRAHFMTRLSVALEMAHRIEGYRVSVLFIDLDRFKYVNDSLGHLVGDELLKEISVRLRDCLRPGDLVARLGGDEFTIVVEGRYEDHEVTGIAERIQSKFDIPYNLHGHEIYSTASIGILHAGENHRTSEDVMRDADTAMYQAKRAGKARHEVFDEKMHKAAKEVLRLETDLRRAVERNEISVYYQPIYDLNTNQIECFESLARWHHPDLGWISPGKFVPLAEEIGLIDRMCQNVLRQACTEIGSLDTGRRDRRKYGISVNLSCRQFSQNDLVQQIRHILAETDFPASSLKLEITESVFFEHQNRAIVMLNQLRDCGIEIDIDDFGTGYSNLGYLKMLPITALKIDRSFVSMITETGSNDEIVRAIMTLARTFQIGVVAEGIETRKQLELLKMLRCERGQGFLFAAPMTFEALQGFLAADRRTQPENYDLPLVPAEEYRPRVSLS